MKKILAIIAALFLILAAFPMAASASNPVSRDGYYKGIKLAGKVKIVRNFGDIKIKVVNSFPDIRVMFSLLKSITAPVFLPFIIRVKLVDAFPRDIGEWEIVDYGEDFTVEIVNSFPDVRVEFVDSFPGVE